MRKANFTFLLFTLFLLALPTRSVVAYDGETSPFSKPLPDLKAGMISSDVIQSWGPTSDKIEYETKREERWIYGSANVLFREAKVRTWGLGLPVVAAPVAVKRPASITIPSTYSSSPQAQELLGEILREVPSGSPDPSPPVSRSGPGGVSGAETRMLNAPDGMVPPEGIIE